MTMPATSSYWSTPGQSTDNPRELHQPRLEPKGNRTSKTTRSGADTPRDSSLEDQEARAPRTQSHLLQGNKTGTPIQGTPARNQPQRTQRTDTYLRD